MLIQEGAFDLPADKMFQQGAFFVICPLFPGKQKAKHRIRP